MTFCLECCHVIIKVCHVNVYLESVMLHKLYQCCSKLCSVLEGSHESAYLHHLKYFKHYYYCAKISRLSLIQVKF